jgi:hypothetical protein
MNEGVNIPPWELISPLGAKFTPRGLGIFEAGPNLKRPLSPDRLRDRTDLEPRVSVVPLAANKEKSQVPGKIHGDM